MARMKPLRTGNIKRGDWQGRTDAAQVRDAPGCGQ